MINEVGLPLRFPLIKVYVHEDNVSALILARTLPQKFMPHSKYYAIKKILFCNNINKRNIALLTIATVEKLGYLFTKGLPREKFEYL